MGNEDSGGSSSASEEKSKKKKKSKDDSSKEEKPALEITIKEEELFPLKPTNELEREEFHRQEWYR